ncbi:hypothetical protein G7A66_01480 [Altererythrobacter sp. SALINAS58]|uniref:hypothetical protein n=1 Tax=Alteripontixanthobacter muriae TaxID=2705546 RepID=UPI001574FBEF|nr:hypothetical protein [Alteripontixanthobacter muriae]NTZ41778.1 hypothetical protein [Alteripontixanthobacter muriae]
MDFVPAELHNSILNGSSNRDLSAFIGSAIESGENLYFPGNGSSRYTIDGQIKIRDHYQHLFSPGLVRLDFVGNSPSENAIEMLSGRRDGAPGDQTRQAQAITGFRLTGPSTASYASAIFVEEGTFFPSIQNVISEAGVGRGYLGQLSDAFLRINGNQTSYVNDVTVRDCVFAGVSNSSNPDYPACGIWIEGCIEGRIENTKVFYFNECMRLGAENGASRNVQFMVFDQVQLEPTKPTLQVDGQACLSIHLAVACTFRDCRFAVGNGPQRIDSVAIRISGVAQQIRFRDCSFQGFRRIRNVFEVLGQAEVLDIAVSGGDIRGFTGELALYRGTSEKISFDEVFVRSPA